MQSEGSIEFNCLYITFKTLSFIYLDSCERLRARKMLLTFFDILGVCLGSWR